MINIIITPGIPKIPTIKPLHHSNGISTPGIKFNKYITITPTTILIINFNKVFKLNFKILNKINKTKIMIIPKIKGLN